MKDDEDIFAFMLAPNLELVDKAAKGEEITPPGLPVSAGEPPEFMSTDCVIVREGERV
jgi:hypothetical protein